MGISQEELAERAELHRTYVSDVERGARNLSLESINRVAGALGLPVAELFPNTASGQSGRSKGGGAVGLVNVLLVENSANDAELALRALRQARFVNRVKVVTDGRQALDYLFPKGKTAGCWRKSNNLLVLLDLSLPKVSGLEVLRRVKMDDRTRPTPVVILTTSQEFADSECQRLGADAYLMKPLNFQRLSQITPQLKLDWTLINPAADTQSHIVKKVP